MNNRMMLGIALTVGSPALHAQSFSATDTLSRFPGFASVSTWSGWHLLAVYVGLLLAPALVTMLVLALRGLSLSSAPRVRAALIRGVAYGLNPFVCWAGAFILGAAVVDACTIKKEE